MAEMGETMMATVEMVEMVETEAATEAVEMVETEAATEEMVGTVGTAAAVVAPVTAVAAVTAVAVEEDFQRPWAFRFL